MRLLYGCLSISKTYITKLSGHFRLPTISEAYFPAILSTSFVIYAISQAISVENGYCKSRVIDNVIAFEKLFN